MAHGQATDQRRRNSCAQATDTIFIRSKSAQLSFNSNKRSANRRRAPASRDPLLYFHLWDLQCARWGDWKLHVARHNTAAYVPAPPGGVHNYALLQPELYNLAADPDESYDVAPGHPEVVAAMLAKIAAMLVSFPEPVQRAYAESKARQMSPSTPVGAWPRPLPPK